MWNKLRRRGSLCLLVALLIFPQITWGVSTCGEEYLCHEALVRFSRRVSDAQIQGMLRRFGAQSLQYFPRSDLYHITLPRDLPTMAQVQALRGMENVLLAAPNWVVHGETLPNDPLFDELWGLHNVGQDGGTVGVDIAMDEVWSQFTDGSGVIVAVIDSGVDYEHEDLSDNMWINAGEIPDNGVDDDGNGFVDDVHGYDFVSNDGDPFDDNGHGTHVAGTVGATGNNNTGVSGVNWNARIMACKFLNSNASGSIAGAVAAIEYALANGAKVLNNSWGGGGFDSGLLNAILASDEAQAIFVAAAGNQARNIDTNPFYPAAYDAPNLISVASITRFDALSSFSNFGPTRVDLGAPGSSIRSTLPGDTYGLLSGTSMATPHVAGAAALLWNNFPSLDHRQVIQTLLQGVTPKAYLENISLTGGILNLATSVALAANPDNHPPVANAGPDQMKEVGQTVNLQGSGTDQDGDAPLSFEWDLETPPGSGSALNDSNIQNPSFVPDQEGTYVATLVVRDFISASLPDSVSIEVVSGNLAPPTLSIKAESATGEDGGLVDLTAGGNAQVGKTVFLDGSGTTGPFPDQLLFQWSFISVPPGSTASLQNTDQEEATFVPDLPGAYTIRLRAEDGFNESVGEVSIVAEEAPEGKAVNPDDPGDGSSGQAKSGCALGAEGEAPWDLVWGIYLFMGLLVLRKQRR